MCEKNRLIKISETDFLRVNGPIKMPIPMTNSLETQPRTAPLVM